MGIEASALDTAADEREMLREAIEGLVERGMPVAPIADRVRNAIVEKRFYIMTYESTRPAFEQRARCILDGETAAQRNADPTAYVR